MSSLLHGSNITSDGGEVPCALQASEASLYFLFDRHHPYGVFGIVVGERHREVRGEAQDIIPVIDEPSQQVLRLCVFGLTVAAKLGEAMDQVRKAERQGSEPPKGHKYTVLYRYDNLSAKKKGELDYFAMAYPRLREAYRLKELFAEFREFGNTEETMAFLAYWCDVVMKTDIAPFKKFVATVKAHWSGIVGYVKARINSGVVKDTNNKIQLAKRRARGYRDTNNFISMIYFIAGKLKFDYPHCPS